MSSARGPLEEQAFSAPLIQKLKEITLLLKKTATYARSMDKADDIPRANAFFQSPKTTIELTIADIAKDLGDARGNLWIKMLTQCYTTHVSELDQDQLQQLTSTMQELRDAAEAINTLFNTNPYSPSNDPKPLYPISATTKSNTKLILGLVDFHLGEIKNAGYQPPRRTSPTAANAS
jgi:hypothetical protein